MNIKALTVFIIITLFLIIRFLLYKVEKILIFQPKKLNANYNFNLIYHQNKFNKNNKTKATLQELFIKTTDGEKINIIYFHNPNRKSNMIYAHGNGGNISSKLNKIHTFGILTSMVFFDYRGYGKSSGYPNEKGLYLDALAVWNFVVKHIKVNPNYITLYGRSIGTAVMARLAYSLCNKKILRPNGLILESGFSNIRDAAIDLSAPIMKYTIRSNFNSEYCLNIIGNKIPVLISHSPSDAIVKYHNKDKLLKASNSYNTYFHQLNGGHNTPVHDQKYMTAVKKILYN